MSKLNLDEPLNSSERYLYACAVRLDALCNMLSSFLEFYADKNCIAVESNKETIDIPVKTEVSVSEEVVEKPNRTRKVKE